MKTGSEARYSLVIPAYNEENRIRSLFDAITSFNGELIVVCDGEDNTADMVDQIAALRQDLTIRCLRFNQRLGKGGGVIAGFQEARFPLVGFFDADGSTSIEEMKRLYSTLATADVVIGSRWIEGAKITVRQNILRRIQSRLFNLVIKILFGIRYHDTQCGAKVFRKYAIDNVLPAMISRGFEFDVELLWRIRKAGHTIIEVPIEWQNKGESRVHKGDTFRMLSGLLTVRLTTI